MTTGAVLRRVDIPLLLQLGSNLFLRLALGGFPVEIENLIDRPQVFFRVSMAIQTPTHAQRFVLVHHVHVVHFAMTANTADPTVNVNRMVEIREVRYLMDSDPVHWLPGFPALFNRP